jgi:hypothetical protein
MGSLAITSVVYSRDSGLVGRGFPLSLEPSRCLLVFVFVGAGFLLSGIVIFLYTFVAHFVTSRS